MESLELRGVFFGTKHSQSIFRGGRSAGTGDRQAHQEVKNGAGFVQAGKKNGRNNQAATVFQKNNQAAACPPQ